MRRKLHWTGISPALTSAFVDELFCVSSYCLYDIAIMVFVDPINHTFYRSTKVKDDSPVWERADLPIPTL